MKNLPGKLQNNPPVPTPSYTNIADGYQAALKVVDDVILKNYVSELSSMEIVPLSKSVLESNIRDNVRFFKITEMVYEKDELATYKFASVFNALSITDSAVFIIIDSDGVKTDFYMGVRSLDEYRTISSLKNTVENAMKGQFPGIKTFDDYTVEDMEAILDKIKAKSISAVSCVANNKAHEQISNQSFVQGLEKLVLSMQGEKYTGIIIANGTSQAQLRELRKGYETVYTQLSAFATTQVNYTSNNSFNYSVAETNGNSHAKNHTVNRSETQTESKTQGSSFSHSISKESVAGKTIKGVASAASLLGAALAPVTGGVSLAVGGVVSGGIGMLGSVISKNVSDSTSSNESIGQSFSSVRGSSDGTTDTVNYGISKTEGYTKGISEGMTLTLHDKSIENTLERINKQLKRIDEFESLGMYECAAYFLSDDQYAAEVAASTYKALMRGENSGVEISAINSWGQFQSEKTALLAQYVKNFIHPVFKYNGPAGNIEVTPCSLVSGNELAIHMGLPRRSVCGLPVIEHADFGKEIVTYDGAKCSTGINLGKIFNMGSSGNSKVTLDVNSLAMHTFVTGSTGSGKSNTVYEIIRQLDNFGVNYMVIEPAKGEYKNVFGMCSDVQVYGTNPQYTNLLRINPFKFPKGIHILEHIDRLIEIFNVCWPMYAAMPAVLKDAVLQAYESCGWDLAESSNKYSNELFPTFADLLNELIAVIQSSAYSEEVKSNYTGSLVTRIKSLTNGLNGQIFAANEINNSELFDKKVIVDISRVGSTETKSLIMGILIMRLSEHRMSFSEEMNSPLRHITVLEEAHNILKRTASEQNPEGSNVAGKSVEMISNAIAEMRTYGEGFIIADQSPSAVDLSAIRNTNTKIIMRLPDEQDRRLAGKAAGLKDSQLDEITKLPKGVAVIYQNDWLEPVLCKIEKFKGEERPYKKTSTIFFASSDEQKKTLIQSLLRKNVGEQLDMTVGELTDMLIGMDIPTNLKMKAIKVFRINGTCSLNDISPIIYDLVCNYLTEKEAENVDSIEEWRNVFIYAQDSLLADFDTSNQNRAIECVLREQIERYDKPAEYLNAWNEFLKKEVM
ncbi:helicase HerA domain-containing protein [Eubacterium ramulus]